MRITHRHCGGEVDIVARGLGSVFHCSRCGDLNGFAEHPALGGSRTIPAEVDARPVMWGSPARWTDRELELAAEQIVSDRLPLMPVLEVLRAIRDGRPMPAVAHQRHPAPAERGLVRIIKDLRCEEVEITNHPGVGVLAKDVMTQKAVLVARGYQSKVTVAYVLKDDESPLVPGRPYTVHVHAEPE